MSNGRNGTEQVGTLIIGAGQAGLSVGYHLARRGLPFLIVDGRQRIGDAWRERWDSLHLFTPSGFDGLDGMPFPAPKHRFPTKNAMADYLESYAARFALPVRMGVRVDRLSRIGDRFLASSGNRQFEADNVVVAMSGYQRPSVPSFAGEVDAGIVQMHSSAYRNPGQLRDGPVLLVGAGNSGSEIAMELAPRHTVWMSGRDTGHIPFRIEGLAGRVILVRLVLRLLFHRVLTVATPIGRKARPAVLRGGGPLIRVKPRDLARAGVKRVSRTAGVTDGQPVLEDGRVLDVANIIWCTGFHPGFEWIDLPVFVGDEPDHRSGIVGREPGLFFVGLHFLHAMSSVMVHGVGRDADRIAAAIARRQDRSTKARASSVSGERLSSVPI